MTAWEVGAPVWALHWQWWEEAGAGRGHFRVRREKASEVKNQEEAMPNNDTLARQAPGRQYLIPTALSLARYWVLCRLAAQIPERVAGSEESGSTP